jgi:folylpolyglutamate synthase/dihydropteroate synthase
MKSITPTSRASYPHWSSKPQSNMLHERSPHVTSLTERFRIGHEQITQSHLEDLVSRHKAAVEAGVGASPKPTHFEVTTALALKHFEEQEVGRGSAMTG